LLISIKQRFKLWRCFDRFEITNGEDIRKWYLDKNYESRYAGTLGKSCMADDMCQPYFDIYTKNPKSVSLIILEVLVTLIKYQVEPYYGLIMMVIKLWIEYILIIVLMLFYL
jgi:hypothetical protein